METKKKLEEAIEDAWGDYEYEEGNLYSTTFKGGFIAGAKWKSQQIYSEEDMKEYADFSINLFMNYLPCIVAKDWFELYKKQDNGR